MTTWICPQCNEELGELNAICEFCKVNNIIVYNPDKYFIREIRIRHIIKGEIMTPQEELFSQLFNHEKILVKDMDVLTLRAHREELSKIAFEARARLTAVDDEDNDRKKKSQPSGPKGFERSLNIDETTTNAINAIKDRQKKLTGKEKMLSNLASLYEKGGMSKIEAEKTAAAAMSAGKILSTLKDKTSQNIIKGEIIPGPSGEESFTMVKPKIIESALKAVFNPFAKKEE
jgi:hypothetical protein